MDAVIIGRNEGARLIGCLETVASQVRRIVYVDSGSTDGSTAAAQAAHATVVCLDMAQPFTAARARNAGMAGLSGADFVLLIDGDCALCAGFVAKALAAFVQHPSAVVVCGQRRERFPDASVYNRLCDREWDTPLGRAKACGGDALMRLDAVRAVGGFRADLIAGEEPELCLRLARKGGTIWRIDADMTLHDAAMTRFGQWWRRGVRAGHAFAEGSWIHGTGPERHWVQQTRRAIIWGLILPILGALATVVHPLGWLALLVFAAQIARLAIRDGGGLFGWQSAALSVLGKSAEGWGALIFYAGVLRGRRRGLIEYK